MLTISLCSATHCDTVAHKGSDVISISLLLTHLMKKHVTDTNIASHNLHVPRYKLTSSAITINNQEGAAVEGPPAMGPSLQLSMCVLFWGFLGLCKAARDPYATCQISSWGFFANNAISRRDLDLWPLDLEIGPQGAGVLGTLPTKFGIRRPIRFPSRWRHGTDRRTCLLYTSDAADE